MKNRRNWLCLVVASTLVVMTGAGFAGATVEEDNEVAAAVAYEATNPVAPTIWAAAPPIDDGSPRAVVFFTDFEGNNGGGVGTLDWEWGTYAWSGALCGYTPAPPVGADSGAAMWGTVLNDCYTNRGNNSSPCTNADSTDDSILSFAVDLSGLGEAWLYWWEWPDINLNFDWAEVRVNGDVVWQNCTGSYVAPSAWLQQEVDISTYVGGPAVITFHFMASTVVERVEYDRSPAGRTFHQAMTQPRSVGAADQSIPSMMALKVGLGRMAIVAMASSGR